MNVDELLFIISFLAAIAITVIKTYNVVNSAKIYNIWVAIIIFILYLVCWYVNLVVFLNDPTTLYSVLFALITLFLLLNILFFAIEALLFLSSLADSAVKAYGEK